MSPREMIAEIGRRLRRRRAHLDLTQAELAAAAGVHARTVANIEGGRRSTRVGTLVAVAAAAGLDLLVAWPERGA